MTTSHFTEYMCYFADHSPYNIHGCAFKEENAVTNKSIGLLRPTPTMKLTSAILLAATAAHSTSAHC